ncbi:MAG TPA: response regulator [Sporichthyaceae bacterium]|jgi:CheY-like chemotaxis protein
MSEGARVLVVDDDPSVRRLIALNLELDGFEVRTAEDGWAALTEIRADPPDVITLDLSMPVLDGLGTAAWLRADEGLAGLPVVLISAVLTAEDLELAEKIGVNAVLTKPFESADLVAAVRGALGRR